MGEAASIHDLPAPVTKRRCRNHDAYLAGVLAGRPVDEIAKSTGTDRKTVYRWRVAHAVEIATAREKLVGEAMDELRGTLVLAARRLRAEIENPENGNTGVTACRVVLTSHHDLALGLEIKERVAELLARGR